MDTPELIEVRCDHCGDLVEITLSEESAGEPIYCSDRCAEFDASFRAAEDAADLRQAADER
jgi:endogenous inhibitor of DNA gyrase (YacG/DUF329 family)